MEQCSETQQRGAEDRGARLRRNFGKLSRDFPRRISSGLRPRASAPRRANRKCRRTRSSASVVRAFEGSHFLATRCVRATISVQRTGRSHEENVIRLPTALRLRRDERRARSLLSFVVVSLSSSTDKSAMYRCVLFRYNLSYILNVLLLKIYLYMYKQCVCVCMLVLRRRSHRATEADLLVVSVSEQCRHVSSS